MPGQTGRESVRVVLDLDLASGSPSGRLVDEQGSVRVFFGWLQLMDGLHRARQREAPGGQPKRSGGAGLTKEE